jgi:thymidylate synthase
MSRRLVVTAWAPANAQTSKLPPCHLLFMFNVQMDEAGQPLLCLHLTQRSADVALGVPYNIAGYAFLLELFSRMTGIRAGIFGHTLVDAHVYTRKADGSMADYDHVPGLRAQLEREPRSLPRLSIDPSIRSLDDLGPLLQADTETVMRHFTLTGYDPHPPIPFKVAV